MRKCSGGVLVNHYDKLEDVFDCQYFIMLGRVLSTNFQVVVG
jgi:hypothetical protein